MINFDDVAKVNIKEHNTNWPQISHHQYRSLVIGSSGSGKPNSLFNLISHRPDIDKIYLCAKDPYAVKYQFLINKREIEGLKHLKGFKAFVEYSNDMGDMQKPIVLSSGPFIQIFTFTIQCICNL